MNIFKLSLKNIGAKPLSSVLSILLVALGISISVVLLLLNEQMKDRLFSNIQGIDLVVSAKGSPLQMILSSVYHVDVPTGNIPIEECKISVLKNPYIQKAIPLALGDSYQGFRIVGTDSQFITHYGCTIAKGMTFDKDLEVVLGASVAKKLNIKIGATFYGSHGLVEGGGHSHDTYAYKVVGILEKSNLVVDQLILTNVSSVWRMHEDHNHDHEDEHSYGHDHEDHSHGHDHEEHSRGHDHEDHSQGHDHEDHSHGHDHEHDHEQTNPNFDSKKLPPLDDSDKEITAYLIQYKKDKDGNTSMRAAVEASMIIDEYSDQLAYAKPAIQLQRIMEMTGFGISFLNYLAYLIIFISALSLFISLYNSLKERKYELALLRVLGANRSKLFIMISLEGMLIVLAGFFIGEVASHLGMHLISGYLEESYKYTFSGFKFMIQELYLFVGVILIGIIAAIFPAIQAYRTDISDTLTH